MYRLARPIAIGYLVLCLVAFVVQYFTPVNLGAPLVALPIGPRGTPVTVTIWYGTEKHDWLEAARLRFEATNPSVNGRPIQIELKGKGSRELTEAAGRESFAANDTRPTVVSPASSIWLPVMEELWAVRNTTPLLASSGPEASQPLVLTPIVLVAWQERADVIWPAGATDGEFWPRVHRVLANERWVDAGGQADWGLVKFGHTSPQTSNSGAQALVLMACAYHNKSSGLTVADVQDPGFITWLTEIERTVPDFPDSTGTFMNEMILRGPGAYDMALVYENLAIGRVDPQTRNGRIEQAAGRWQPIRVYYPPANMLSDHPYAILQAPWVSDDQRAAAVVFRDFLLSRAIQELALEYGFRPGDPNVAITTNDPNNPFVKYQQYGVQIPLNQQIEVPRAEVLRELLEIWRRQGFDR